MLNVRSKHSLFGLLNHTITKMASRLLRSTILSPSTSIEVIDTRLDVVAELYDNEERFHAIRKALQPYVCKSI